VRERGCFRELAAAVSVVETLCVLLGRLTPGFAAASQTADEVRQAFSLKALRPARFARCKISLSKRLSEANGSG